MRLFQKVGGKVLGSVGENECELFKKTGENGSFVFSSLKSVIPLCLTSLNQEREWS